MVTDTSASAIKAPAYLELRAPRARATSMTVRAAADLLSGEPIPVSSGPEPDFQVVVGDDHLMPHRGVSTVPDYLVRVVGLTGLHGPRSISPAPFPVTTR